MGLDMYFYAEKYDSVLSNEFDTDKVKGFYPPCLDKLRKRHEKRNFLSVTKQYQIGYWRKANAIHKFFVDNCADGEDDCKPVYVAIEDVKKLKGLCEEVLADNSKAPKLLPTTDGFFFGGTQYDEWYYNDLKYTLELCNNVIEFWEEQMKRNEYWNFVYEASW